MPTRVLGWLGGVLVVGGLAHAVGVLWFYSEQGLPDANRVLLDIWVGEAQIIGGSFYLSAYRGHRAGSTWRAPAIAGAVTILSFVVPFLPVLFARAPVILFVPQLVYGVASFAVLVRAASARHPPAATSGSIDAAF